MERKLKITEGEWIIDDNTITDKNGFSIAEPCEFAIYMNWSEKGLYHWSEEGGSFERSKEELEANAQLITEAGTVANECDLMPRELLNQRNELLKIVKHLAINMKYYGEERNGKKWFPFVFKEDMDYLKRNFDYEV